MQFIIDYKNNKETIINNNIVIEQKFGNYLFDMFSIDINLIREISEKYFRIHLHENGGFEFAAYSYDETKIKDLYNEIINSFSNILIIDKANIINEIEIILGNHFFIKDFLVKYNEDAFFQNVEFFYYLTHIGYVTTDIFEKVDKTDLFGKNHLMKTIEGDRLYAIKNYYINKYNKNDIYKYNITGTYNVCDLTMYHIVKNKYQINKCENCGKYFIPFLRSDTLYCDRTSPQDDTKTCKEYGSREAYKRHLEENEANGLCRKLYMQIQMTAKRNPDIQAHSQEFENFKIQSKQWKSDVKSGKKTEEEFITWLYEVKNKRY